MLIREALRTLRLTWRPLYLFTLLVTGLATLVGSAVVGAGFLLSWGTFEEVRRSADQDVAYEDPIAAYIDGTMENLQQVGAGVTVLLLALAAGVVAVLQTAYTVAFEHTSEEGQQTLTVRVLWARMRPHIGVAYWVQWRIWLRVGAVGFLALAASVVADSGVVPGVERTSVGETATWQYRLVGGVLPITVAALGLLVYFRHCVATAALVTENSSPKAAVRRAWALTKRAPWKTYGIGLLLAAAVALAFVVLRYAAAPVAHVLGLGMLWLSDDNPYITGVLVLITPTAVALLLLPLVVLPFVCSVVAVLYRDLRAREPRVVAPVA
ncbi:hypothetical protein QFZ24_006263 [Streptomyces phaeochromogenes]|uniref:hypothetical protein n=1 Tax=Streptomyces phaeochromogenes TaxID=1923 RepID=UPI002794C774|nr:hypothetical protein [Streptomyces phaeochromogenes]MDQ0952340.1 hypothetical protein [Streptomyces phaeochromogenes]